MANSLSRTRLMSCLLAVGATIAPTASSRADYSISNNLSGTAGGVETASGSTELAAGFGSGAAGGQLSSVTLLLSRVLSSTAEVDLYTDDGLNEPGSKLATLTLMESDSSILAPTTFGASGITLAANTNYWVVLQALTGQFDWSWTSSNTGTGAGYQNTWGTSADAGSDWFTYSSFPTQMNVVLAGSAAVPEPGSLVMWGLAVVGVGLIWDRSRRLARPSPSPVHRPIGCPA